MARLNSIFVPALLLAASSCTAAAPTAPGPTGAVVVRVVVTGYGGSPAVSGARVDFLAYSPSSGKCTLGAAEQKVASGTTDLSGSLVQEVDGLPINSVGSCFNVVETPPSGSGFDRSSQQVLVFPETTTPTDTTIVRFNLL